MPLDELTRCRARLSAACLDGALEMQRAAELRRQGDDAAGAVPSERSHAFNALFAELRHAAAAVRASREPTVLEEYEHAHSIAWAAWAEARERTGEALSALHAAQHERLLVRRAVASALRVCCLS